VRLGQTAQADAALTETAESERERPGIRTAVAALRLAPRADPEDHQRARRKDASDASRGPARAPAEPISQAEARVLRLLQTGLSAPEIARELYVSVNTIRTHMRHLYDKLGAHRRLEAIDRARALGLLAPVPQRA
jgi:ATP/maltotriose-dependent transcriptional regulator MalT